MASKATIRIPLPPVPAKHWGQEWARNKRGQSVKLHVLESNDGRLYVPEPPVVLQDHDGRPACRLTIRLNRRAEARDRVLAPLIEQGTLNLRLSLGLGLPAPYRPLFLQDATLILESANRELAVAHGEGASIQLFFTVTLEPAEVLAALAALEGRSSDIKVVTKITVDGSQSPASYLSFDNRLDQVLALALDGVDRSAVIQILEPTIDGSGYEPVPQLITLIRDRSLAKEPPRLPVMVSNDQVAPVTTFTAPRELAPANAHALLSSEAAHPVAANDGTKIALIDNIALLPVLPPGSLPLSQSMPMVADASLALFPDTVNAGLRWYAPVFSFAAPAASDDPAKSTFLFSFKRTGMTADAVPRPTLSGSVRFVLNVGIPDEAKSTLAANKNLKLQPLPLDGLSVMLDVPYMQAGELQVQSLQAQLQRNGDTITATVPLLDDAVRMAYTSLAFPGQFQSQPARIRVAYTYQARVPIPQTWPMPVFGGKVALTSEEQALRVARDFPGNEVHVDRPVLQVSNQASQLATRPRFAIRSIGREQSIDAKLSCANFGGFYMESTDAGPRAIGCTNALDLGEVKVKLYDEVVDLRDIRYRVYRALTQPGLFLVAPAAYRVTRYGPQDGDDKAFRPAIMIYSIVDPDPTKSKFFFQATLQPDIPVDARIALATALATRTPANQGPSMEDPTELSYVTPPVYRWTVPAGIDSPSVQMLPDSFSVGLTAGMDNALLLLNLIERSGLNGSVTFAMEDGTTLESALILDTTVTGPWSTGPVQSKIAPDSVTLTNRIERPVNVFSLMTRKGADAPEKIDVNATLPPGASQKVAITHPTDQAYCTFSVGDAPMRLDELDIFVEDLTTNVIFVNQVVLASHGLKGLSAQARLKGTTHVYQLNDVSGASTTLTITLPLTTYLSAQTLEYEINKIANDGSTSSTAWLEADLSKGSVLSITWDLIKG